MYCVNCGVRLADTEEKCPLCGVAAWHPERKPGGGEPLYPPERYPEPQVSPKVAQIIVTTVFLLPFFITALCDLQMSGTITWSGYVMGALAVAYVILVLPTWFQNANPVIFVPCDFAAVGLYLLYISLVTGGGWFLSFAFPVTGGIGIIVTVVAALLRYVHRGRFYVFGGAMAALGVFSPVVELLLCLTFDVRFVGWSLYPLVGLILFGGMLFFLAGSAKAKETARRKFFI